MSAEAFAGTWDLEVSPGRFLGGDLRRLVRSVSVEASSDGADELAIEVEPWDSISGRYRLVGETILGPGSSVVLWGGWGADRRPIQRFRMIREEMAYSRETPARATLRGYSAEARLVAGTAPRSWEDVPDGQIVRLLAQEYGLAEAPGSIAAGGLAPRRVKPAGTTDLEFLSELAAANGFPPPIVRYDPALGDVLIWRSVRLDLQEEVRIFRLGGELDDFAPSLSIAQTPVRVEVLGWDRAAGEPIRVVASLSTSAEETTVQRGAEIGRLSAPPRVGELRVRVLEDGRQEGPGKRAEETRTVPSVGTAEEALAWGRRWLETRIAASWTARATTRGYPAGWVGQAHRFEGLAPHHGGLWEAVGVRHQWDLSSGFRTSWDLIRVVEERIEEEP
jgi:phage protein D